MRAHRSRFALVLLPPAPPQRASRSRADDHDSISSSLHPPFALPKRQASLAAPTASHDSLPPSLFLSLPLSPEQAAPQVLHPRPTHRRTPPTARPAVVPNVSLTQSQQPDHPGRAILRCTIQCRCSSPHKPHLTNIVFQSFSPPPPPPPPLLLLLLSLGPRTTAEISGSSRLHNRWLHAPCSWLASGLWC
ncbi:hypothetical protein JOL62DRAFT_389335 [Phyllosticta paracitricarpa]|uniref:Uncharacterized protein n=1 Tax=Phyllosticta paracitricarpa TaxID=2016321 RepID=A0ABR1NET9_9PEZI